MQVGSVFLRSEAMSKLWYSPASGAGSATEEEEHESQNWPEWKCFSEKRDRKSTRLNSSHLVISYAVFCLKKKKNVIFFHSYDAPSDRTPHPAVRRENLRMN